MTTIALSAVSAKKLTVREGLKIDPEDFLALQTGEFSVRERGPSISRHRIAFSDVWIDEYRYRILHLEWEDHVYSKEYEEGAMEMRETLPGKRIRELETTLIGGSLNPERKELGIPDPEDNAEGNPIVPYQFGGSGKAHGRTDLMTLREEVAYLRGEVEALREDLTNCTCC